MKSNWMEFDFARLDSKMVLVHEQDRSSVTLIQPEMKNGPWIAGGAVLNWYNREPVNESDIDIFFRDLQQFDETFGRLMRNNASIVYSSDNAITLGMTIDGIQRQLQLIRKEWFDSPKAIIDKFDFTICQLVTDGFNLEIGSTTAEDIKNKKIKFVKPAHKDVVKRIVKYIAYGYLPDPKVMQDIIDNQTEYNWKFNTMEEHYENAF